MKIKMNSKIIYEKRCNLSIKKYQVCLPELQNGLNAQKINIMLNFNWEILYLYNKINLKY